MDRDQERIDSFSRRALMIGGLQGIALGILGMRLSWLQVVEGDKYKTLSENNRINVQILPPSRGQIVDRYGVPLATNLQNFQVLVTPEQVEDFEKAIADIRTYITLDDSDLKKALRQKKRNPSYVPVEVRDHLEWEEVSRIELALPHLPGVSIQAGELRNYPYKDSTAHIVGYVGRVSENEMTEDPLLSLPGFQIGKTGIEKTYEMNLRGKTGQSEVEVNVHGRAVRELGRSAPQTGDRLTLTIDAEYQRFVHQRLSSERSAAAAVMDCVTGEIYAMASYPSYDPNVFAAGISVLDWEQLRDDPAHPLSNKVTSGVYPPGSTFKIVTALAGLEAGAVNEHSTITCPGHFDLGNTRFHCWKAGGHGTVDLNKALQQSCDTYFYKLAQNIGIDKIAAMARRLGLGEKLDVDLEDVKAGLVPDQSWKKTQEDPIWHPGETINAAIGQGYMLASPLQLAVMLSRVVNGGKAVTPVLGQKIGEQKLGEQSSSSVGLSQAHLEMVKRGLVAVTSQGGTAYGSRITEEGMAMGGKTGTSQVKRITKAERAQGIRRQEDMPWHLRHHALFVGYAPTDNPRYVASVIVEHGGSGSGAAAPIAHDILLEIQKRNPAGQKKENGGDEG
ncbi:MAG: penicillin-binding protein 2 [Pseudobdellovibrionaceae bacterium]